MRKNRLPLFVLVLAVLACQVGAPNTPAASPAAPLTPQAAESEPAASPLPPPGDAPPTPPAAPTGAPSAAPGEPLPPFEVDLSQQFAGPVDLAVWTPGAYAGVDASLPVNLDTVANLPVLENLTPDQRAFLAANGFVVIHSQEPQFADIRTRVSEVHGQPYFLTSDAAYHALHLLFDEMLKAIERQWLRPAMIVMTRAVLDEVIASLALVQGSALHGETEQAAAYLSVALKLFDPQAALDASVVEFASAQVEQILLAAGRERSVLFPEFEDDYGAYKPVGHYAGDPELENYFRGMTWYGRVHFQLKDAQNPAFKPSRVPLIITLALRRARLGGSSGFGCLGGDAPGLEFHRRPQR